MSATRRPGRRRSSASANQWAAHPYLGAALRVAALLVPVAVAILTAVVLAQLLPAADSALARVAWWVAVLGGSTIALLLTDRLARRLLPLAILLELSLVFPDRAPSRLRAARTVSVREMEQRLTRLRTAGVHSRPIEAAETLVTLVSILGLHDSRTRGHSERVRALTDLLSAELDLPEEDRIRLRWAALVHDLGKLTVPAEVLNGGRDLTDEQWAGLRRHPEEGVRLVAGLLPWLGEWGRAVGEHHERWDGTGYPKGLGGDDIGYAARIVSVADSFETMTAARSYSKAMSADEAREELTRCAGSQFDPAVVRAFLGISVGRLRWVLGPLTWLAEVPFVATADRAGQAVKAGAIGMVVGGLLVLGVVPDGDGGAPFGGDRAPSYTELTESAAKDGGEGGEGSGPGGGLAGGTANRSPLLAVAGNDVFGLGAAGGLFAPGATGFGFPGTGGGGFTGTDGAGEQAMRGDVDTDGDSDGSDVLLGPLVPVGPLVGVTLPTPEVPASAGDTGGTGDVAQDAGAGPGNGGIAGGNGGNAGGGNGGGAGAPPAPAPQRPQPPAPRPAAPPPPPPASGGEGATPAEPASPAQPGGPGQPAQPAEPATPAQPANRDGTEDRGRDGEQD